MDSIRCWLNHPITLLLLFQTSSSHHWNSSAFAVFYFERGWCDSSPNQANYSILQLYLCDPQNVIILIRRRMGVLEGKQVLKRARFSYFQ